MIKRRAGEKDNGRGQGADSGERQGLFGRLFRRVLWRKLQKYGRKAGIKVIYAGLLLFYALREPGTPNWAKGVIFGALGYFIAPIDAIADFIPVAGYSDDMGMLLLALASVAVFINDHVKEQAKKNCWTGFLTPRRKKSPILTRGWGKVNRHERAVPGQKWFVPSGHR